MSHHPNRTQKEEDWLREQRRQADREASFMFAWQRARELNEEEQKPSIIRRLWQWLTR